jgi:hypothetical protein
MTQENWAGPQPRQIQVELNGGKVWVDPELSPLLIELNKVK